MFQIPWYYVLPQIHENGHDGLNPKFTFASVEIGFNFNQIGKYSKLIGANIRTRNGTFRVKLEIQKPTSKGLNSPTNKTQKGVTRKRYILRFINESWVINKTV